MNELLGIPAQSVQKKSPENMGGTTEPGELSMDLQHERKRFENLPQHFTRRLQNAELFLQQHKSNLEQPHENACEKLEQLADAEDVLTASIAASGNSELMQLEFSVQGGLEALSSTKTGQRIVDRSLKRIGSQLNLNEDATQDPAVIEAYLIAVKDRIEFLKVSKELCEQYGITAEALPGILTQINEKKRDRVTGAADHEPPVMLRDFSQSVREKMMSNTFAIELNKGCSVACTFCAFSAGGKVSDAINFQSLLWLMQNTEDGGTFLYYATDPLDYQEESNGVKHTYADVLNAYRSHNDHYPYTSTAIPARSQSIFLGMADKISRFSITEQNLKRLKKDGVFSVSEKGSLIPTHPAVAEAIFFGSMESTMPYQAKAIRETTEGMTDKHKHRISDQFWESTSNIYNFAGGYPQYTAGKKRKMIPIHVEGADEHHPQEEIVDGSIACRYGILILPDKVQNSVRVLATNRYPDGVVNVDITQATIESGLTSATNIAEKVSQGSQEIYLDELLPYCIVKKYSVVDDEVVSAGKDGDEDVLYSMTGWKVKNVESTLNFFCYDPVTQKFLDGWCKFDGKRGKIIEIELPSTRKAGYWE